MKKIQGMDLKSIKKHPSLIPLYFVLFSGLTAAVLSTTRAALKNPDVSWNNKKNPEPWQEYADKRYQLFNPAQSRGWHDCLPRPKSIWD